MCATCGCQGEGTTVLDLSTGTSERVHADAHPDHSHDHIHDHDHHHEHGHHHPNGDNHSHSHDTHHDHAGGHDHTHHEHEEITVESRVLAKNDALAARNRGWFAGREILALNLVSSPGSGKTTLLERTIAALREELPLFVIEGDQATANDGERIRRAGAPAVQVNTGTGCHLDADMVAKGLATLKPPPGAVVLIENVGNLICPALFDLGERGKVVIFSVTEGEDKPLKYPHMFASASIVVLSKIDLLPHLDFDLDQALACIRRVNPDATVLQVSARSGAGMEAWFGWLRGQRDSAPTSLEAKG
jgi:hydrogenase nickel incorporation protein HypB